jgi:hypothetical protein
MPKVKDTVGSRMSERRKYKKTKLRKSRKNILKKGGAPPKTENEDYKATMALFTSIFPSFETTLNRINYVFGLHKYLKSLIGSLIGFLETFANAIGCSNMSNKDQVELILKPALTSLITSITNLDNPDKTSFLANTAKTFITSNNITTDSILDAATQVSQDDRRVIGEDEVQFDKTSKTYKTKRINVLLSKVPKNQLIPELITHLKVYNEGKYYSGNQIQKYVFPESTLESSEGLGTEDDGLGKEDDGNKETIESPKGLGEEDDENKSLQEVKGGKKKSRARNKLYNTHKKMYSRRKTKHNHRY